MEVMTSKEEGVKSFKTCDLKVHIHCNGCKQKVKRLLQKINGIHSITIDAENARVTVSGHVDPTAVVKSLARNGKHAELLEPAGVGGDDHRRRAPTGDQEERKRHKMRQARGLKLRKLKDFMIPFGNSQKYVRLLSPEDGEEEGESSVGVAGGACTRMGGPPAPPATLVAAGDGV